MVRIFKYPIALEDEQLVKMPHNAKILSVQEQKGKICLWAMIAGGLPSTCERKIFIYGTGHEIKYPERKAYIGTVQQGPLVWHVFEEV